MQMVDAVTTTAAVKEGAAPNELRKTANKLVGSVFYGTLLKQMRSSTLKGKYGHGGRGEDVFAAQLDQVFAEEAGKSRNSSLTDAIVRQFQRQAEAMERFTSEHGLNNDNEFTIADSDAEETK